MTNENFDSSTERTIIGFTHHQNPQKPNLGYVQPIGELINNKLCALNEDNFCKTMQVFITSGYEELATKYPDQKLFQLKIRRSVINNSESVSIPCKFVATFPDADSIRHKDYFEVLHCNLPDAHHRIIAPDNIPSTPYVFVDDGSFIFGPFQWGKSSSESFSSVELDFLNAPLPSVKLAQYQTYKIAHNKIASSISINQRSFIQGLDLIQGADFYDYASDDEVVKYCAKLAGENGVRTIEPKKLTEFSQALQKNPKVNVELNRSRLSRLVNIGNELSILSDDDIKESLKHFLKNQGASLVKDYVSANEAVYLDKLRKENQDKFHEEETKTKGRMDELNRLKNELNDDKNKLATEIQQLKEEKQKVANLQVIYDENDKLIAEKQKQLLEIETRISEHSRILGSHATLDDLNEKIKYAKQRVDEEKNEQSKISATTSELKSELAKADGELQKKLTQLKPYVDAINGSFSAPELSIREIAASTNHLRQNKPDLISRQAEVVQAIRAALASKGRSFEDWQVANLLISTQQSFLTIFAGLPGVGKTSLARLLAETQNIQTRLQEVPVSRGWTSQKDLIGFYNPLTSRFQPSNTGLYDFLSAIHAESDKACAMAYILLDEANLSPVEHYWSAFMGMADNEGDRTLTLGQQKIKIPESLRFIATINYDGTTEPLSPRLINRAPIIVLDSADIYNNAISDQILQDLPISASLMSELFGTLPNIPDLESDENTLYADIKNILLAEDTTLGRPVSISPRKEIVIRQYCAKARGLMNIDSDLLAFDIAMQQHLLPLIQGHGKHFGERLNRLQKLIQKDLPESSRLLKRMITAGEADLHTYDFFCW